MDAARKLMLLAADIEPEADPILWDVLREGTERRWGVTRDVGKTLSEALLEIVAQLGDEQGRDAEAAAWVREHGGIGCVQTMVATLGDTLNWIRERFGIGEDEVVDYDELLDALDRRLMPDGYEWPRYDTSEPVMFGDCVENRNGTCTVKSVRFYSGGGVTVYGEGRGAQFVVVTEPVMHDPIRKARPKVPAADGEPLEVGQTVWDTDDETDTPLTVVEVSSDLVRCEYTWKDGKTYGPCYLPSALTHTKPEPSDSAERIADDIRRMDEEWCSYPSLREASEKAASSVGEATMGVALGNLSKRCRALAERERGEK